MQCRSHTGEYYFPRYFKVGLNGHSWPITQGEITWSSSGQNFNVLLPRSTMDRNVGYQKEIFRQMMLKHEATFKYQVYELHRVYGRQKELMEEIRKREASNRDSKPHSGSELRSDFSFQPSSNLTGVEPSVLSSRMCQGASCFLRSAHPTKDVSKECELSSSSRINKSRKRTLDLELPAHEYVDSDEDDFVRVPEMPKLESFSPGGSSVSHPSCRNATVLFDLNAPARLDDSGFPSSATLLESDKSMHEIVLDKEAVPDIEHASGHDSTAKFKVSDSRNLPKVVDLNVCPSDDEFTGHTDIACRSDPLEETNCSGKSGIVDSSFSPNPTAESSTCISLNSDLKKEFIIPSPPDESDAAEAAKPRDLEAPVSPENKECSPPRRDSQEDNQLKRCIGSLKPESELQEEESDKFAADTLCVIASSGIPRHSNKALSDDCLNWFAGIASSTQENHAKEMETVDASLPSRLRRRQKKMKLQPNNSRNGRGRRRQSKALEMTACSPSSKQQCDPGKKQNSVDGFLAVWGKTKKRQMARVARSVVCSPL